MSEPVSMYYDPDGRKITVYASGLEKDERGKIVKPAPGTLINSTEKALEYVQRSINISRLAKIRAFAKRQGVNIDNCTDEELLQGYANAQEAVWGKGYDLVMEAKTGRSIEALFSKMIDEDNHPTPGEVLPAAAAAVNAETARIMAKLWTDIQDAQRRLGLKDVIEGEVKGDRSE